VIRPLAAPLFALLLASSGQAQREFTFTTGRELGIVLPALAFQGVSIMFGEPPERSAERLRSMDREQLPAFERQATHNWSLRADRTSDLLRDLCIGGSLAMALIQRPTPTMGPPLALMGETILFTTGLTNMTKALSHRARPYVFNPDAPADLRMKAEAYRSFWSGHAAVSAATTFCCAYLVQQSDASAATKTITWTMAAVLPALTAHYRVRAGRHFITDVAVGYAIGAGIGLAIPALHYTSSTSNGE
jgi:membrane-associated phospholipid phosphatase